MTTLSQHSPEQDPTQSPPLRVATAIMGRGGHWRRKWWWLTMLMAIAVVAAGIFGVVGMHTVMIRLGGDKIAVAITLFAVGLITFGCVARVWLAYWRRDMDRVCGETPPEAPQRAFYRAQRMQLGGAMLLRRKLRDQWLKLARSTGVVTWVDQRIADDVLHLPRLNRPIEPERVGTFWQQADSRFAAIGAMIGGFQLMGGNTVGGVIWLGVAALMVTRLLRRGALFEPVVAGQGWVQHGRARWTVEDSVAIIKKRTRNGLHISVVGPPGTLSLQVSRRAKKDDAMREFWLRWCHPTPRLEQAAFDA